MAGDHNEAADAAIPGTRGPATLARALAERFGPSLEPYVVARNEFEAVEPSAELVWDSSGAVHARFDAAEPALCLVRPDGHLGFRAAPPDWDALEAHLGELLLAA